MTTSNTGPEKELQEWQSELLEMSDSKAIIFPDLEDALIGYGQQNTGREGTKYYAIYSYEKIIKIYMERDGMTYDEAVDYFSFNTAGVGGENFPVIHFEFR